jgi:hypothetical protein
VLQHRPETQTLYAQLFESTAAYEVELLGGFANGLPIEREVRQRSYLYWQLRDVHGKLKQIYLGPADDDRARALHATLTEYKDKRRPLLEDLERLTAAYVASGGARHIGAHWKVVDALARAGVFRASAVLVGSHAFVSIGAALGVSFDAGVAATGDVDICRDAQVSVACEDDEVIDLPGVLKEVDPSFFLVPELDLKAPSTSLKSRKAGVGVDLLTPARTARDTRPRPVARFGMAAQPLRYMDYLVREDVQRGLFIGPSSLLVNVPHPGRYAIHKLAVAARRVGGPTTIKADKDRRQAGALLSVLREQQPGAIAHAVAAATAYGDQGFLRDVRASAAMLPEEAARSIAELING